MRNGDGGWYPIALDCAPFLFPPPAVKTPSHSTFPIEHDPRPSSEWPGGGVLKREPFKFAWFLLLSPSLRIFHQKVQLLDMRLHIVSKSPKAIA